MKILAFDTSTSVASVAVTENQEILGEYLIHNKKTHSINLMPMADDLLKRLGLKPSQIDLFAACSGPGSFTGLRIGISSVKTMGYIFKKPVVGITSLDILVKNISGYNGIICPIMDARNRQVYTAIYNNNNAKTDKIFDYNGILIDELLNILKLKNERIIFTGDAVKIYREEIAQNMGESAIFTPDYLNQQRASIVASLAYERFTGGNVENAFDMVPFYLRKSQAERVKYKE